MGILRKVAFAAMLLATTMAGALAQGKPPIKIGHLAPMTGFAGLYGQLQIIAIKMAVEDINESGGINGSKIEVLTEDDQLDPAQAVRLYRSLAGRNVFAVIGPMSGTQWETVSPMSNQLRVPTIAVNAAKPGITSRPWSVRLVAAEDTIMLETVAEFFSIYPKIEKVVIVADVREASSKAAADSFKELSDLFGRKVIEIIPFSTRATDLSPAAVKIKGLKPDAVLYGGFIPTALLLAKAMHEQGINVPVLGNSIIWPGNFPHAVGEAGTNWHTMGYSTNEVASGNSAQYKKFAARFLTEAAKLQGIPAPANISNNNVAYDALMLLAKIMRENGIDGSTPVEAARSKIQGAMNQITTYVALNTYRIRPSGDAYIPARVLKADVKSKIWVFAR